MIAKELAAVPVDETGTSFLAEVNSLLLGECVHDVSGPRVLREDRLRYRVYICINEFYIVHWFMKTLKKACSRLGI